jgi:hypothetical protein
VVQFLISDVVSLYLHPEGLLHPLEDAACPEWKKAGAKWLLNFYGDWRDGTIPDFFFSGDQRSSDWSSALFTILAIV